MPSNPPAHQFVRISSNGFAPLFDSGEAATSKLIESQLKKLAKGTFHDDVGPDKSLSGKSLAEFLAMIAGGEIGFLQATEDKASLNFDLRYVSDGIPSELGLSNPKSFVTPAVIQTQLEGNQLLLRLDLRLELKYLLRPAACAGFLNAINKKAFEEFICSFTASTTQDPCGYSCTMFRRDARFLSFDTYATKKLLLAAS